MPTLEKNALPSSDRVEQPCASQRRVDYDFRRCMKFALLPSWRRLAGRAGVCLLLGARGAWAQAPLPPPTPSAQVAPGPSESPTLPAPPGQGSGDTAAAASNSPEATPPAYTAPVYVPPVVSPYPPYGSGFAPYPNPTVDPRPRYLPYREGEPAPPGYEYEEEIRRGPVVGGFITLGVPYLLGLLIAAQEEYDNKKAFLVIPALGPWLTLLTRDSSCDPSLPISSCDEDSAARFALVLDGLLQTAGGVIAASGLFNKKKRYVRSDWRPQISLVPRPLASGMALTVSGSF